MINATLGNLRNAHNSRSLHTNATLKQTNIVLRKCYKGQKKPLQMCRGLHGPKQLHCNNCSATTALQLRLSVEWKYNYYNFGALYISPTEEKVTFFGQKKCRHFSILFLEYACLCYGVGLCYAASPCYGVSLWYGVNLCYDVILSYGVILCYGISLCYCVRPC